MSIYVHVSEPWNIVKRVEQRFKQYIEQFDIDNPVHIVNNSGGKDSGVTDLLARHILGDNYRSVAADTGNEHRITIEHLKNLHINRRGGPVVEIITADYPQEMFDKRKDKVLKGWRGKQVVMSGKYRGIVMPSLTNPNTKFAELWRAASKRLGWGDFESPVEAFESVFHRSGNPFLDMCLLHGSFPIGRQRFCTEELKMQLVMDKVLTPLLDDGREVIQWSGVRADESEKRSTYPMFEEDKRCPTGQLYNFLPIHDLTVTDVFTLYNYFGVKPNPLYKQGMDRVGCMPCILVKKPELAEIGKRFPEEIARIAEWEKQVAMVSRWTHWMIVGHVHRNQFKSRGKSFRLGNTLQFGRDHVFETEAYKGLCMLGPRGKVTGGNIYDALDWANDKKADEEILLDDPEKCSTRYGFCG